MQKEREAQERLGVLERENTLLAKAYHGKEQELEYFLQQFEKVSAQRECAECTQKVDEF